MSVVVSFEISSVTFCIQFVIFMLGCSQGPRISTSNCTPALVDATSIYHMVLMVSVGYTNTLPDTVTASPDAPAIVCAKHVGLTAFVTLLWQTCSEGSLLTGLEAF